MFQSANIPQTVSKELLQKRLPELREELLEVQHKLRENKAFATIILLAGVDGSGKGAAISRLYEWMDTRYLFCNAYHEERSESESARPNYWRYWRDLPARGETSIVFGSWYQEPLRDAVMGKIDDAELERQLSAINRFEKMLAYENILLLKFWFTLPKAEQQERLHDIEAKGKKGRNFIEEWSGAEHYRAAQTAGEKASLQTSTGYAPWFVIPSQDPDVRDLALAETIAQSMKKKLESGNGKPVSAPAVVTTLSQANAVDAIDLSATISKEEYKEELEELQDKMAYLTDRKRFKNSALSQSSRAMMQLARAVQSAASPAPWTRGTIRCTQSQRLLWKKSCTHTSGASGAACRRRATVPSSTALGMSVFWWNASRASALKLTGCEPTTKSTLSKKS